MCYNKLVCYTRAEFARIARRVRHKSGAFSGAGQYELPEINEEPFALEISLIGAQRSGKSEFSEFARKKYKSEEEFYVYGCNL